MRDKRLHQALAGENAIKEVKVKARRYHVNLIGETPLLMHQDNLSWEDKIKTWLTDPENAKGSQKGDDRSPAWKWIGSLYHEGGRVVIPADNIMTMLREGGARCPTGSKNLTYMRQTQSGIMVDQSSWPLLNRGKEVPVKEILALVNDPGFAAHEEVALELGFELFVKRARIGKNKHVRVRPRFDDWECSGTVTILDDAITQTVLENILIHAGMYAGVGDWRPSSPSKPGSFGKFSATVKSLRG